MNKKLFKGLTKCYLFILNLLGETLLLSGIFRLYLARKRSSFIIMYHYPTKETLISHLEFFRKYFHVTDFDSMLEALGKNAAVNNLCITFDDGYQYIFDVLFTILARAEIPFSIFLSTMNIESGQPFWWDIFEFKKRQSGMKIRGDLKSMKCDVRERILDPKTNKLAPNDLKDKAPLCWSDIKTMLDSGLLRVGDHGYGHVSVTLLSGEELRNDLLSSQRLIKERLGVAAKEFSYPNGDFALHLDKTLKNLGYRAAVTTLPKDNQAVTNVYFLRRIEADNSDLGILVLKIMGVYYPLTGFRLARYLAKRGVPVRAVDKGQL